VSWQGQWESLMVFQNGLIKIDDDACEDPFLDLGLIQNLLSNGMQRRIK
jgi:hypothetical protein